MVLESSIRLWVDETERIVSFHAVPGIDPRLFTSRDEMLTYVTKDAAQAPCFSYGVKLQGQRVLLSIRLHLRK